MFNRYKDKKILILGFGVEGKGTYGLIRKHFPHKQIAIADKTDFANLEDGIKELVGGDSFLQLHLGDNYLDCLKDYEVIFKSPGISANIKEIKEAIGLGVEVTSQAKLFFDLVDREKVVGITGTKGKSTTTTLIYEILKKAGKNAFLVGNIGNPPLEALEQGEGGSLFVYEMSSYQLEDLNKSPHVAVFLNLYEDHLDYHGTKESYRRAKENIFRHQNEKDHLIIQDTFSFLLNDEVKASIYLYSLNTEVVQKGAFLRAGKIYFVDNNKNEEEIIPAEDISLKGNFNTGNAMAAIIAAKILGADKASIVSALQEFKALPHRIEFVDKVKGVSFYDDSISTIPQATLGAIEALGEDVETLIMGGYDRNINFDILAEGIAKTSVKNVILFPGSGARIWESISKGNNSINHYFVSSMKEAVDIAIKETTAEKICLLSPASPSFGIYKDYKARGNAFKEEVKSHLN